MHYSNKELNLEIFKQENGEDFLFGRKYGWFYQPWDFCENSIHSVSEGFKDLGAMQRATLPQTGSDMVIGLCEYGLIYSWGNGEKLVIIMYEDIKTIQKVKRKSIEYNYGNRIELLVVDNDSLYFSNKDIDSKIEDEFIKFIKIKIGEIEPEPDPNTLGLESLAILRDAELEKVREKYKKGEISEREFKKEEEKLSNIFDFRLSLKKD